MSKRAVLIDCPYICHRALYRVGRLSYHGHHTGIIYGFLHQLGAMMIALRPTRVFFCWDSPFSFRREALPVYKEHRREGRTPQQEKEMKAAYVQFDLLREEILPAIGFRNNYRVKGLEADDLFAILLSKLGGCYRLWESSRIIVSADEDLYQLLNQCSMCKPGMNGKLYTQQELKDEWGVSPPAWADVKAIAGCASDNVPGIPGVGIATACKFLRGVLPMTTKAYKAIASEEGQKLMRSNRRLVRLPWRPSPDLLIQQDQPDVHNFLGVCREYGMKKLANTLPVWEQLFARLE